MEAFSSRPHCFATTAAFVFLAWLIAAAIVAGTGCNPAATMAIVFAIAFAYTRCVAREAGITHALAVGIAWLVLSILTEFALTIRLGHGWYSLIGSPAHPLLRNLVMFAWIFAPALFARQSEVTLRNH